MQTWWWPEWTFAYDEYVCVHKENDCAVSSKPTDTCDGVSGMKSVKTCDQWGWKHTVEPWNLYDVG